MANKEEFSAFSFKLFFTGYFQEHTEMSKLRARFKKKTKRYTYISTAIFSSLSSHRFLNPSARTEVTLQPTQCREDHLVSGDSI